MSRQITAKRTTSMALVTALLAALLTVATPPQDAYAAGERAYVKNLSSSNCFIYAVYSNKKNQLVLPGRTSTIKAMAVMIPRSCKARWHGKGKWNRTALTLAVSQTKLKTIQVVRK